MSAELLIDVLAVAVGLVVIVVVVDAVITYAAAQVTRRQIDQKRRQCSGAANVVELRGWRVR